MKAMIFAAGMGTRLRPLTDHTPKALVPVAGIPMLQRVILRLKEAGFDDITVNVHHLGEQIVEFLKANNGFGIRIHISDESDCLLETGGGILKARPFLDGNEPFLVHNADILTDLDLRAFYRHHVASGADATLLVSQRKTSRYLLFDDQYRMHGWTNRSTGEVLPEGLDYATGNYRELAFGGIHMMSPSIFRLMDEDGWNGRFSIIPFYLKACGRALIQGYPLQEVKWFDIGKPETLQQAESYLQLSQSNIGG